MVDWPNYDTNDKSKMACGVVEEDKPGDPGWRAIKAHDGRVLITCWLVIVVLLDSANIAAQNP